MALETAIAVPAGAGLVAGLSQEIAHAAMGVDMIGFDPQGGVEVKARLRRLADAEQQIREIDMPRRIFRMVLHGCREDRVRRIAKPGIEQHGPEIIQRAEMSRHAPQQLQIVALRLLERALLTQQAGAFEARLDRIGIARDRRIEPPPMDDLLIRRRGIDHGNIAIPVVVPDHMKPAASWP
jgi:hypothetical protein